MRRGGRRGPENTDEDVINQWNEQKEKRQRQMEEARRVEEENQNEYNSGLQIGG